MSVFFKDFPGLENLEKKIQGLSRTRKSPVNKLVVMFMVCGRHCRTPSKQVKKHVNQLSGEVDISCIKRNEISISGSDLIHAILHAGSLHAVQVRLYVLSGERHYHVLTLHHLIVRDDAPASSLQRTFVQRSHTLVYLGTYGMKTCGNITHRPIYTVPQ